jgi:hypothetical protein
MKFKNIISIGSALLCLGLFGCGGGGGGSASSPFTGSWLATDGSGDSMSIGTGGQMHLTSHDSSTGEVLTVTGKVASSGSVDGSATLSQHAGVTLGVSGTATLDNPYQLSMVLTFSYNGSTSSAAETFAKNGTVAVGPISSPAFESARRVIAKENLGNHK